MGGLKSLGKQYSKPNLHVKRHAAGLVDVPAIGTSVALLFAEPLYLRKEISGRDDGGGVYGQSGCL